MNLMEAIIKNESLEEVVAVFALKVGYPLIDRSYVMYGEGRFSNLDVLSTYQRLVDEGVLVRAEQNAIKGPNWKEPAFVSERKYDGYVKNDAS